MWVQPWIHPDVWDEPQDRDSDRLVNLSFCRAIRVRGVRAEGNGDVALEPVDDTSHTSDATTAPPEALAYRRWEVAAALAVERAAPGQRTAEILAAVPTEVAARQIFREIRAGLGSDRALLDLSAGLARGRDKSATSRPPSTTSAVATKKRSASTAAKRR